MNVAYPFLGFFLGLFIFLRGMLLLKQKRMIENIPTSKIRSVAMGLVEIFGEVIPTEKKILKSPFSNEDCVYYRYKVQEYRNTGKNSRWVTVKKDEKGIPFFIRDSTGSVLVDPRGAKIDISRRNEYRSGMGSDPPEQVNKFMSSHDMSFNSLFGINKKMRFMEWFLGVNEKIYVMGTAKDNPFLEETKAKSGVEDVMIGKGRHEKIFYMSNKKEGEILKRLTFFSVGGIMGGAFLALGSLALVFLYFNIL